MPDLEICVGPTAISMRCAAGRRSAVASRADPCTARRPSPAARTAQCRHGTGLGREPDGAVSRRVSAAVVLGVGVFGASLNGLVEDAQDAEPESALPLPVGELTSTISESPARQPGLQPLRWLAPDDQILRDFLSSQSEQFATAGRWRRQTSVFRNFNSSMANRMRLWIRRTRIGLP